MNSNLKEIYRFAHSVCTRITIQTIIHFSLILFSTLFFLIFLCNLTFNVLPLVVIPFIIDVFVCVEMVSLICICLYICFVNRPGLEAVVRDLEHKSKMAHPVAAISLEFAKEPANYFVENIFAEGARQTKELQKFFPPVFRELKYVYLFAVSCLLMIPTLFLSSSATRYWKLPLEISRSADAVVYPGSIEVPLNTQLSLKLLPTHKILPFCKLSVKTLDNGFTKLYNLHPDSLNRYVFDLKNLKVSTEYVFSYGSNTFKPETITVIPPPSLSDLKIRIKSPDYIGSKSTTIPDGIGDFNAFAGSEITISIQSNPLRSALLHYNDSTYRMIINNKEAYYTFKLTQQGKYSFSLIDTFNQKSDSLPEYQVSLLPDEFPLVQILKPGFNKELGTMMSESLHMAAYDDIGVTSVFLNWYTSNDREIIEKKVLAQGKPATSMQIEMNWSLSESHLYPGDTLFYWVTATDSWPYLPKHISTSDTFWFRIPGFDEIQKDILEKEDQAENTIKNVRENQKSIEELIKNSAPMENSRKELSWDQKKVVENAKEAAKSQADSLNKALSDLEKSAEQLKSQGALGEELSEKMNQIQKTLEDLIKQYGDSLFPSLNKKENLNAEDLKKAIDKAREILPELSKSLDNALQYLEMLKRDREIASLAMKAEKLAGEQVKLADDQMTDKSIEQQKSILDKVDEMQQEMSSTLSDEQKSALKNSVQNIENIKRSMRSSSGPNKIPQKDKMNQMSSSLLSLSDNLRQMMSSAQMEKLEKDRNRLLEMAHNVLSLVDWQKQILSDADNEQNRKDNANFQQTINDALRKVAENADSLSMIPPAMIQSLQESFKASSLSSQQALQSFNQSDNTNAISQSMNSLQALANSLLMTSSNSNQQGQSGGSGGMNSGLRKLSAQQSAINSATSDLLRSLLQGSKPGSKSGSSNEPGSQEVENARRAAQQAQQKIAEELKKLSEQYGKEKGESVAKRMDELRKEAQKLAEMLGKPQSDISEKQNAFLSRMLQSALSLHKQDETKEERKSTTSQNVFTERTIDKILDQFQNPDQFFLLKRKALQGNFPEAYRSAINNYFDSLGIMFFKSKALSTK